MRKRLLSVLVPILLVCVFSAQVAQAATQRAYVRPSLSFSGTTATCSIICRGNSTSDDLDVTLTLYQGTLMLIPGVVPGRAVWYFLKSAKWNVGRLTAWK